MTNLAGQTDEMAWQTSNTVMKIRQKHRYVNITVETLHGWSRHLSGRNAWVLAFFTFLSIFPLMLAATTILGFVLEDNDALQKRLVDGAADRIPILGETLRNDPRSLNGSVIGLVIGLASAVWSSTKAFVGLQGALDDTWEIGIDDRAGFVPQRGKAIAGILILGGAQVGNVALTSVASALGLPAISQVLIFFGTVAINIVVMAAMFRFLTSASPSWGDVWPGAIMAGVIFAILQRLGPAIVQRSTEGVASAYQTFFVVIGLVTWLSFIAIALLMAAELNAAIVRLRKGPPDAHNAHDLGPDFDLAVR